MKATIITIGDEILYGQTVDTNSAWIGTQLNLMGIEVLETYSISDERVHILETVDRALSRSQVVFVTGGLGPTNDDITKNTLAEYFKSDLVYHPEVYEDVQNLFHRRGLELLERNKQQAWVPEACEVIRNSNGTAPGMWFETNGHVLISMPGVPLEMKAMVTDFVLPKLREKYELPLIEHRFIMTAGVGESRIAEKLIDFEEQLPEGVAMAYLPSHGYVKLRLTARGDDREAMRASLDTLEKELYNRLGDWIYGTGRALTLEKALGDLLLKHGLTMGTAESCTGGFIGHRVTTIPGSSAWFKGGIISYDNQVKEQQLGVSSSTLAQYGAVSEETVREMLTGLFEQLPVEVGIAVSGVAGPDGGTPEKPVGTVWVAYGQADDIRTKKLQLHKKRLLNIELTATLGLNLLRRYLLETFEKRS